MYCDYCAQSLEEKNLYISLSRDIVGEILGSGVGQRYKLLNTTQHCESRIYCYGCVPETGKNYFPSDRILDLVIKGVRNLEDIIIKPCYPIMTVYPYGSDGRWIFTSDFSKTYSWEFESFEFLIRYLNETSPASICDYLEIMGYEVSAFSNEDTRTFSMDNYEGIEPSEMVNYIVSTDNAVGLREKEDIWTIK